MTNSPQEPRDKEVKSGSPFSDTRGKLEKVEVLSDTEERLHQMNKKVDEALKDVREEVSEELKNARQEVNKTNKSISKQETLLHFGFLILLMMLIAIFVALFPVFRTFFYSHYLYQYEVQQGLEKDTGL